MWRFEKGRFEKWKHAERGVTLIELLVASTILGLIITGICAWINQTWETSQATQNASRYEQQATTIMSQLVRELHNAQVDDSGKTVTISDSTVAITTASGVVTYRKQGDEIVYENPAHQQIVLAEVGDLQVETADQKTFAITLTVGASRDPQHVVQTTRVTRYDWGN